MSLLPVFFMISDLRVGAGWRPTGLGKKGIIGVITLLDFSTFLTLYVLCCVTCGRFAKEGNFVA